VPHEFIVDRDLGKRVVASLSASGWLLHPLPDVFGSEEAAMDAEDEDWITIAGSRGWAALSKNHRISHVVKEREALIEHRVPLFAMASGNLSTAEMVAAYLLAGSQITAILDAKPGGGLWAVHKNGAIVRHWPPRPN
jgi:PIN like domain